MDWIVRIIPLALTAAVFAPVLSAVGFGAGPSPAAGPEPAVPVQSAWPRSESPPGELTVARVSPLNAAKPSPERSEQLEDIARQADRLTRHGFELAGRGAFFAARAEFLGALRLIAAGLDAEGQTDAHCRALAAGLTALKEAEDFMPDAARLEAEPDLPRIIAAHATPALKDKADRVASMTALRRYFTYAQEQFAAAAGSEVAGSMALRALGKLYDALAGKKSAAENAAAPKAMVFYQAALLAYPENFLAANDLGVLLARSGNYASAQKMLEYSLSLSRHSATWRNLAAVHRQLGRADSAQRAEHEAALCEQAEIERRRASSLAGNAPVRWVDPQILSRSAGAVPNYPGYAQPPAPAAGQPPAPNRLPPTGGEIRTAGRPAPAPAAAQREYWKTRAY